MRALLVLGACAVLASPPVVATTQPAPATFIGVIRSDGALAPIAVFDGRDWWNAWPWASEGGGVKQLPIPASLDAIPSEWLPPRTRLPRDTVRIGNRMLWVMRVHLEDGFGYTLFDPVLGDPVELKGGWGTERQQ